MATASPPRMGIIEFVLVSIAMIITSTIVGVLVEWIGMWFWWPDEGARHAMNMVVNEAAYLNHDFIHATLFGWTPLELVNWVAIYITGQPLYQGTLEPTQYIPHNLLDGGTLFDGHTMAWIKMYLLAAVYILMVCIIRFSIILFTLPLYALFYFLAFLDGLMLRDLRRFGGARESGIRHHYAKKAILPSLWGGWGLYMAIPVTIHPNWILVPSVLFGSFALWVATRFFKKYL
jgi:integrating conjugative element membrane protein (TIGR03747 family)